MCPSGAPFGSVTVTWFSTWITVFPWHYLNWLLYHIKVFWLWLTTSHLCLMVFPAPPQYGHLWRISQLIWTECDLLLLNFPRHWSHSLVHNFGASTFTVLANYDIVFRSRSSTMTFRADGLFFYVKLYSMIKLSDECRIKLTEISDPFITSASSTFNSALISRYFSMFGWVYFITKLNYLFYTKLLKIFFAYVFLLLSRPVSN